MSADNWATCPRCQNLHDQSVADARATLDTAYGTVPLDEFDTMRASVLAMAEEKLAATFREDYEIYGAEDGEVEVSYCGACQKCGLSLSFKHQHALDVDGAS